MLTDSEKINEARMLINDVLAGICGTIRRSFPPANTPGGQYGEDSILAKLLPEPTGFYIDVGAGEPRECSNTWQFYARGWRGVLVEPLPQFHHALLRQRPGDYLVPVAAMARPGLARMRIQGTVSSLRPDWLAETQTELWVETDTLINLLAPFPQIRDNCSLLSIDVEGSEAATIKGIDWSMLYPKVVVVEFKSYAHDEAKKADLTTEWESMLLGNGYGYYDKTAMNKVYVRR